MINRKTVFYILCIYLLFLSLNIFPQNLQGKVTTDNGLPVKYARIWIINDNNVYEQHNAFTDSTGQYSLLITDVDTKDPIPGNYELKQNYPNPFSAETKIDYVVPIDEQAALKIYDILGREIKTFNISLNNPENLQSVKWDGYNNNGQKVSPGVYFYQLIIKETAITKKMLFLPGAEIYPTQFSSLYRYTKLYRYTNIDNLYSVNGNNYEIIVTNSDSTSPLINAQKITSVYFSEDTVINFTVENETDPGYYLYVGVQNIHIIDTYTNTIVDTIYGLTELIKDMVFAKNTNKLFVSTRYDSSFSRLGKIYMIDIKTKEISLISASLSNLYLTPDGVPLVVTTSKQNDFGANFKDTYLGFIDTLSYSITYFDTLKNIYFNTGEWQQFALAPDSNIFYTLDTNYTLFAYNYEDKIVTSSYTKIQGEVEFIISHDGNFLYVANGPIIDLKKDSIVGSIPSNPVGSLALDKDGLRMYITDPGNYFIPDPPPSGIIDIFNTVTKLIEGHIDVNKISGEAYTPTDRILITPDGRTAYVGRWLDKIFVIDLTINEIVKIIDKKSLTLPMIFIPIVLIAEEE